MQNSGIFGTTLCGKTTLAKYIALCAGKRGYRALVLDIWQERWPANCHVYHNEESFWPAVWKSRNCLVIVDEASTTIARDATKGRLFTAIRHVGHKLIVIGHSGVNLLPEMRESLTWLFLFRQTTGRAKDWHELFAEPKLLESPNLGDYQFLWATLRPRSVKRCKLVGANGNTVMQIQEVTE